MTENTPTQNPDLTDEVVKELHNFANKTGIAYDTIEKEYLSAYNKPEWITAFKPVDRRKVAFMLLNNKFIGTTLNGRLTEYEVLIVGITANERFKNAVIVAYTRLPGDDLNGFGVPTTITANDEAFVKLLQMNLQLYNLYKMSLSQSAVGVQRRMIRMSEHTQMSPIPDRPIDKIGIREKHFQSVTLDMIPTMPDGKMEEGYNKKTYPDRTDIKSAIVTITKVGNEFDGGQRFYTVVDGSLTDEQKNDLVGADGRILKPGGVSFKVPGNVHNSINCGAGSVVEMLFNFSHYIDKDKQRRESIDVIGIDALIPVPRKVPVSQTPKAQKNIVNMVSSVDLTTMA